MCNVGDYLKSVLSVMLMHGDLEVEHSEILIAHCGNMPACLMFTIHASVFGAHVEGFCLRSCGYAWKDAIHSIVRHSLHPFYCTTDLNLLNHKHSRLGCGIK